ncbi:heme-binding protein 1-like isoform 1-T1 [Salvelinus alpinus]|uniref:heme-binding protein 1-like isoform X1 n=1 Tax=Salvelinus alpinus TaxID=8036 RepID=UPI0039FCE39E
MALISLEDLDGLEDEELDNDITDNPEPMEDDEQQRLYTHWQAIASTHQVSVPREAPCVVLIEMTGPIQELTQRNQAQEREQVPFSSISQHEKLGEVLFEERVYPAGKWACITKGEKLYEQSISMGFMKLMKFICKENSVGRYLGMTVPIVNSIQMLEDGNGFQKDILTAYYLPAEFQANPPQPTDPDITILQREALRVITMTFFGTTTEETIMPQINLLWEMLGPSEEMHRNSYMVAVYDNPGVSCRRNELWFIRRDP